MRRFCSEQLRNEPVRLFDRFTFTGEAHRTVSVNVASLRELYSSQARRALEIPQRTPTLSYERSSRAAIDEQLKIKNHGRDAFSGGQHERQC